MNFSDFFNDSSDIIQTMAKSLDTYTKQYQEGELSIDEYNDLCNDATILDDVAKAGMTIEELAALDKTISILKEIVSNVVA